MPEDDVTLGELRRNIQDMRIDYERGIQEARQDTQKAINVMQRSVDKLVDGIERLPYVRADLFEERVSSVAKHFEERQKTMGERLGNIEGEVKGVKGTLSKINFTAWTAIVLPLCVGVFTAMLLAVVNLK